MTPYEIAKLAVQALDDKKGRDISVLKTEAVTVLADYFVICTASSAPHAKTLVEEADHRLSEAGEPPLRREGYRSDNWVLLDFGSVIVHVFLETTRQFYALERLWADAERIDVKSMLE